MHATHTNLPLGSIVVSPSQSGRAIKYVDLKAAAAAVAFLSKTAYK